MIRELKTLLLLSVMLSSFSPLAMAEGYSVIVHPSNSAEFDKGTVERIFLSKEKTFTNGQQAVPIEIQQPSTHRDYFQETIIRKTDSQVRSYWAMLMFSGKGTPPKEVASEAEVLELISKNPNTLGYIPSDMVTADVKVVLSF